MATVCCQRTCLAITIHLLFGLLCSVYGQQLSSSIDNTPFFFYCKQYDRLASLQRDWDQSSVKSAQVDLVGNPKFYVAGRVYKVTVKLQEDFDTSRITGVYSANLNTPVGQKVSYHRKMCSILHTQMKPTSSSRTEFLWMAPPEDVGCVDFVGTFMRQEIAILKDERIYHICPAIESVATDSIISSGLDQDGIIFRDDFESGLFMPTLWSHSEGFQISNSCDPFLHGLSATICPSKQIDNLSPLPQLSTVAFNTSSAGSLQFSIGRVSCSTDKRNTSDFHANVTVFFGHLHAPNGSKCANWTTLQTFTSRSTRDVGSRAIRLPKSARQSRTCFRWSVQTINSDCVAIDDVVVTNTADPRSQFHVDFDPLNPSDWLSLSGGHVHSGCKGSRGSALVLKANQQGYSSISTQDLKLDHDSILSDDVLWRANFDTLLPNERWEFYSAQVDDGCRGESNRRLALQHSSINSLASACSPSIDLSLAGNLRFRMERFQPCNSSNQTGQVPENYFGKLDVWIERDSIKRKLFILSGLELTEEPVGVSLAIPSVGQVKQARICWQFTSKQEVKGESLWVVDEIHVLPVLPSSIEYVLQFRLNTECNQPSYLNSSNQVGLAEKEEFHINIQYSNDMGITWVNIHEICLPPSCLGARSSVIETSWSSGHKSDVRPWERTTLPLPYALLTESGRIRFIQKGRSLDTEQHWALDDIHLDHCPMGCSGHGTCLEKGICSCDDNYQGEGCQFLIQPLAPILKENFERDESVSKSFSRFSGGRLSSKCHSSVSGLAAVFDQSGRRQLVTIDMDTTDSHILQFGLGMHEAGSRLHHHCPSPDRPVESIYVHSSCNGGMTWSLLQVIQSIHQKQSDRPIRIHLSSESRGSSCRFKFWQSQHSGAGQDIWSIDDLYIGPNQTQALIRNGSSIRLSPNTDAFVGRHPPEEFCKRDNVMLLQAKEMEETHPVRIEPFSLVQFEVVVGCDPSTLTLNTNHVVVQYSIDGGKHWNDLNGTRRHATYLQDWRRIGLKLPPITQSGATRFRIAQTGRSSERSSLAIDYFYAGSDECPELCRGNGRCSSSGCICDKGFTGESCLPESPLPSLQQLDQDLAVVIGGRHYTTDHDGCLVRGTRNYLFDGLGTRLLETKEIQYTPGVSLLFFLRLGDCESSHDGSYNVNVKLEVSWDGGSDWFPLREYRTPFYLHPRLEQVEILVPRPYLDNPPPFKIRFIQTDVHAKDRNIWSLAGLTSSSASKITVADIEQLDPPLHENRNLWLVLNEPDPKSSCLVFDTNCLSRIAWYGAYTKEIILDVGDSIQFELEAQRSDRFPYLETGEEILFQYSSNGGNSWHLVQPECFHSWSNCLGFQQSSRIDFRSLRVPGSENERNRFHFNTSEAMANKPILLRWLFSRVGDQKHHPLRGFQVRNLYIGTPCPSLCSGHGHCLKSVCTCDDGFSGLDCSESDRHAKSAGFYDTFPYIENSDGTPVQLKSYWDHLVGGKIMPNYCNGQTDGIIFFGDRGPRLLQTSEIDTQSLRMIQFTLTVTAATRHKQNCQQSSKRQSSSQHSSVGSLLVLDYSIDNGLTWHLIETWPMNTETDKKRLGVKFPASGKTPATAVRWWQLTFPNPNHRDGLQWYLDDVLLNLNMTNPITFEYEMDQSDEPQLDLSSDETSLTRIADWLGWRDLMTREPLYPVDTLLRKPDAIDGSSSLSYAETWDMEIIDPTFAQFQILLSSKAGLDQVEIRFEFSTDMGRNWNLVEEECYFLHQIGQRCEYLHPPSRYQVTKGNNATRITVHLPKRSITESTRFRWISDNKPSNSPIAWGIGHVYIGGTCPWMCSGHGTCHNGVCNCDSGYGNEDCVPIEPLSNSLVHHFEGDDSGEQVSLSGGSISGSCGILMSGQAAVFYQDGLRYFETTDLDLTSASFLQMTIKFNCWAETESFMNSLEPSHHRLLLQYSVNGGITWILIQEIKRQPQQDPLLLIVDLMRMPDLTNCTRFRVWQSIHAGEGWDTWAVDGFVLHSISPTGVIQTSSFDHPNTSNAFLTWFGGQIQSFCSRDDALVFSSQLGENQVLTGDSMITSETTLQFEVNVGCGATDPNLELPVRLEYSNDGGRHWNLVVSDRERTRNPYNRMPNQTPTVYSSKTNNQWRRETILLSNLETSRPVRFRWHQGYLNGTDGHLAPQWALRNVILSPQCPELCNGHGQCTQEGTCLCDNRYQGYACETVMEPNPQDFHESFHDPALFDSYWARMIGGEYEKESSSDVGIGGVYVMNRPGVRLLETRDLDTSNANFIQFYLDSSYPVISQDPSYLFMEYSVNGGIEWTMFEVIPLDETQIAKLFQVSIPSRALSPATRIKWSHLGGDNNQQLVVWTLDEIYIGGEYYAKDSIETELTTVESIQNDWLFVSGGKLETSMCDSNQPSLHFSDHKGRSTAVTKDIKSTGQMYLQYETSTGCNHPKACNRIKLEYSENYGLTWRSLPRECQLGEEVDCNAYEFHTELLSGATGYRRVVTLPVPSNKGVLRFRWNSNDQPEYDWTLHWVYIGSSCGDCNGRGRCWKGSCVCHSDWTGSNCEIPSVKLVSSVREVFHNGWNSSIWTRINGGQVSSMCGTLDSAQALYFHEACDRYAETRELDLHQVNVVQFHLRSDCSQSFQYNQQQDVLLFQYSLNGGVKWQTGLTLSLDQFSVPKLVSFVVPPEARQVPVKLRWWQLRPVDRDTIQDWAIDSIIFDSAVNLTTTTYSETKGLQPLKDLKEEFQADQPPEWQPHQQSLDDAFGQMLWWRNTNSERVDSYCGRRGKIWRGRSNTAEESTLETSDFLASTAKDRVLSFDMVIGECVINTSTVVTSPVKIPVRFEISYNHGIDWNLFHPLKTRGDQGLGPQMPSVYYKLDKWQTFQYPLDFTTGARFVRFRWRHSKSPSPVFWAVNNFRIEPFRDFRQTGLKTLSEDFNDNVVLKSHWRFFSGGKIIVPDRRLGDGAVALFHGPGLNLLQTVELDLTFARSIQFIIAVSPSKSRKDDGDVFQNVILQCSPDRGLKWILIQEYSPVNHTDPSLVYASIPIECQGIHSLLRWWQPIDVETGDNGKKTSSWLIDNIAVEYAQEELPELYDSFKLESFNKSLWLFHPGGVVSGQLCDVRQEEKSLVFTSDDDSQFVGITSKHISIKDKYAAYFKLRTNCGAVSCNSHNNRSEIRFEMKQGYEQSSWSLVQPNCLPSSSHSLCEPLKYHKSTTYPFGIFNTWKRFVIPLKSSPFFNSWQFRWITRHTKKGEKNTWAIKDVYIGSMCPFHCHGHGDCILGRCHCDSGYQGTSCSTSTAVLSATLPVIDHFDEPNNSSPLWESITGGSVQTACGSLLPLAHGKHLYFDGCGNRMAITVPINNSRMKRVAFVIRIGTPQQIPSCRVQLSNTFGAETVDRAVLLQYSFDGVDWFLLASHGIQNFIQPQRMIYDVPLKTNATVQLRWWQPHHGGANWDQWALDNVEILI